MIDFEDFKRESQRVTECACGDPACYIGSETIAEPQKILFLDFDGVLNSKDGFRRDKAKTLEYITPECAAEFRRILGTIPDLYVCISSTWRRFYTIRHLRQLLSDFGIPTDRIIGRTPSRFSSSPRGLEIKWWLEDHPYIKKFAIVDDDIFDMGPMTEHCVKTDTSVGLTAERSDALIERLK